MKFIKEYFKDVVEVMFKPKEHIWNHKFDNHMEHSEIFLVISTIIAGLFFFTYNLFFRKLGITLSEQIPVSLLNSVLFVVIYITSILLISAILHAVVVLFNGKENYIQTFKPLAYSSIFLTVAMIIINLLLISPELYIIVIFLITLIIFFGIMKLIGYLSEYTKVSSWKFTLLFIILFFLIIIPLIGTAVMSSPW